MLRVNSIGNGAFSNGAHMYLVTFEGNAPILGDYVFSNDSFFTIRFYEGALGFSTPEWNGYKTEMLPKPISPEIGDVNGDGVVSALDVLRLRQYLAGWNVTISSDYAADCNGDGDANALDILRLRQYLAGWKVKLGK